MSSEHLMILQTLMSYEHLTRLQNLMSSEHLTRLQTLMLSENLLCSRFVLDFGPPSPESNYVETYESPSDETINLSLIHI